MLRSVWEEKFMEVSELAFALLLVQVALELVFVLGFSTHPSYSFLRSRICCPLPNSTHDTKKLPYRLHPPKSTLSTAYTDEELLASLPGHPISATSAVLDH
jgi:hypothetical protein